MQPIQHTQSYLRKRKMLMVLPILVLPFLTLGFWALGGGKAAITGTKQVDSRQGLNLQLPDARLKEEKGLNKLSYYDIAAADSARIKERMRNDPYFKTKNTISTGESDQSTEDTSIANFADAQQYASKFGLTSSPYNQHGDPDASEEKVMKKLKQLNAVLDNTVSESPGKNPFNPGLDYSVNIPAGDNEHAGRLNNITQQVNQQENSPGDPEMKQLDGMLDKIMDIQHPDRIGERVQQYSPEHQQQIFPVTTMGNHVAVSLLSKDINRTPDSGDSDSTGKSTNSFYSIEELHSADAQSENVLEAVVHETQTIVSGSVIKFRLLSNACINGRLITKDHFVFGTASLNGERLIIEIKNIRYNSFLFPVDLSVYDMDGMDGIYIPGAIARNSAKESSDKAIQSVALNSLDPTIGARAASAGIEAARSLLSKKIKLVKVTIKAGYRVLLKNNNTK